MCQKYISPLRLLKQNAADWMVKQQIYFLTVLETRSPRSRFQLIWFLVKILFLTFRWLLSCYVLMWPFLSACMQGERESALRSFL